MARKAVASTSVRPSTCAGSRPPRSRSVGSTVVVMGSFDSCRTAGVSHGSARLYPPNQTSRAMVRTTSNVRRASNHLEHGAPGAMELQEWRRGPRHRRQRPLRMIRVRHPSDLFDGWRVSFSRSNLTSPGQCPGLDVVLAAQLARCVRSTVAIGPARRRGKSREAPRSSELWTGPRGAPSLFPFRRASAPVQLLARSRGQRAEAVALQVGLDRAREHPRLGGGAEHVCASSAPSLRVACRASLPSDLGLSDQRLVHLDYPVNVAGLVNAIHETLVLLPTLRFR